MLAPRQIIVIPATPTIGRHLFHTELLRFPILLLSQPIEPPYSIDHDFSITNKPSNQQTICKSTQFLQPFTHPQLQTPSKVPLQLAHSSLSTPRSNLPFICQSPSQLTHVPQLLGIPHHHTEIESTSKMGAKDVLSRKTGVIVGDDVLNVYYMPLLPPASRSHMSLPR